MTAPIASGWSDCRVGFAPTGKRRLCTAHTHFGHQRGCPETAARRGKSRAETDRVGVMDQVSPPAKISFLMTAWTTQFPSTHCVMPQSTPTTIKHIASYSYIFSVVF